MARKVSYSFVAVDKFSRVAETVKRKTQAVKTALAKTGISSDKLRRKFKSLGASARNAGNRMKEMAGKTAIASAAAGGFVALSISNFDKQASAIAKVENAIKSTGGAARLTLKQLTDEATLLQSKSLFGDETILEDSTATLLTFTKIADKEFSRANQAVIDISSFLKLDLKSSAIQVGKALNDPVKGIAALSRTGVQFSKAQEKVIKNLAETNRVAEAQNLILDELEVQFGGAAAAAAKAGAGPVKQLKNSLMDLTEGIGQTQLEVLQPFIGLITRMKDRFEAASPGVKRFVAISILLVAALTPILFIVGAVAFILGTLGIGFAALVSPIALGIAAVVAFGVLIAANFEAIKVAVNGTLEEIWISFFNLKKQAADFFSTGMIGDVLKFVGVVDSTSKSQLDVNMTVQTPKDANVATKVSTSGQTSGLKVGLTNVEAAT